MLHIPFRAWGWGSANVDLFHSLASKSWDALWPMKWTGLFMTGTSAGCPRITVVLLAYPAPPTLHARACKGVSGRYPNGYLQSKSKVHPLKQCFRVAWLRHVSFCSQQLAGDDMDSITYNYHWQLGWLGQPLAWIQCSVLCLSSHSKMSQLLFHCTLAKLWSTMPPLCFLVVPTP